MKQTEKDIKAEKDRLDLAKERKANNDKLIEQEKQLRKEASNLDDQIKAEKDKQKMYEKQNDALKKQSNEQKKLADDLKKTNEEIQKMRMSLSKYVYCQYDLHNNLIKQYYLNDVKINFSEKIINILKKN